jgi:hypothetical protein
MYHYSIHYFGVVVYLLPIHTTMMSSHHTLPSLLPSFVFLLSCYVTVVHAQDCTLCPDGSDVGTPDRLIPFVRLDENRTDPTCQDYDDFARTAGNDSFGCELAQAQAGYCGCPGTEPVDACKLCDSDITRPDKASSEGGLCLDIMEYTRFLSPEDCQNTRGSTILAHAALCGCPGVEAECSLCPDGVAEVPDPKLEVFDGACGEIFDLFQTFDKSACDVGGRFIAVNGVRCGCRDVSEFPACSIRQNDDMCTKELLDGVVDETTTCECYNFCGEEFLGCQDFPGKKLQESEVCPDAILITGCNYAGVTTTEPMSAAAGRGSSLFSFLAAVVLSFLAFDALLR